MVAVWVAISVVEPVARAVAVAAQIREAAVREVTAQLVGLLIFGSVPVAAEPQDIQVTVVMA